MNKSNIVTVFILASLFGCQIPAKREPSSLVSSSLWEELRELKQKKVELSAQSVHFEKKKKTSELKKIKQDLSSIDSRISEIESKVSALNSGKSHVIKSDIKNWRNEKEKIELNDLNLYSLDKNVELSVSTYEAIETEVQLTHNLFSKRGIDYEHYDKKAEMEFAIKCDAPFILKYGLTHKKINAHEVGVFKLADKKYSNDFRDLVFTPEFKACEVSFLDAQQMAGTSYRFKIVNEEAKLKKISPLLLTTEACSLKKDDENFFETTQFLNTTCPTKYDSIKILPEPEDSLHARVVSLLGQDLPSDFIKNGNPFAELDFSRAPKFDALLVSYLVFRADFYGTLIGRLLAYHADQGALVRVIVSDVIALSKDEAMYEKLMANHPNLKFIKYKFDNNQQGGAWISEFHRTNHVKLFIAYSKDFPKDSMAIVGGRNIHDGFVFKTPVDVSKYPEVVNYVSGDESWAYWRDFEMVIRGQNFVESLVRHYMNFYHVNKKDVVMKLSSVSVSKEEVLPSEEGSLRHYISIPYKDEPNLNLFYAGLIDSSKKKILISSPYFRPVKEIAEALDRAAKRGVDITIITRLDLEGDTADFILGAVNKDGVNRFLDKVKVFEYIEPKVILHSKLLMIDDEVSFISSVNLNKRSFYHDLENGVVVNDSKFTKEMGELYKDYLKISKQLTKEQKIIFWKKWLINIFDKVL